MLPLSHIHVATKVSRKKTPLLVFGSVLPDVSWTSQSEIGRDQIHYSPRELYEYVSSNCPDLLDLALGVRLHSNVDKGADFYSDGENFSGFAYQEGVKIEHKISKLLGGKSDLKSKVLSHNFIEAGTDLSLLDDEPDILRLYSQSIDTVSFDDVSVCLGKYLNLDSIIVRDEIDKFLQFIGPESYSPEEGIVGKMSFLIKARVGLDVENKKVVEILNDAKETMKNKYRSYLDEAIDNMKKDFSGLISK